MQNRNHTTPPPRTSEALEGVLVVDKPAGPTSHDVVYRVRKVFGIRKVGHGGTLDPLATGVLVLLLGRATRMANLFLGSDKTYEGTMRFGVATDSHDAAGKIIAEADCSGVCLEDVTAEFKNWVGDRMQEPPMVSAIKKGGIPLYKYARRGKEVKREPRLIHVYALSVTAFEHPTVDFVLRCTKGTYVRKICSDVGEALGCHAHLTRLRRTASGELSLDDAIPVNQILQMSRDELERHLLPVWKFSKNRHHVQDSP